MHELRSARARWEASLRRQHASVCGAVVELRARGSAGKGGFGATAPEHDVATEEREHQPLLCRQCGNEITDKDAVFGMDSDMGVRVFPNPYGQLREIITVLTARGLLVEGPATTEFTWFPGFAWEVAYCCSCRAHLGWQFTAAGGDAGPRTFFGLLRAQLVEP